MGFFCLPFILLIYIPGNGTHGSKDGVIFVIFSFDLNCQLFFKIVKPIQNSANSALTSGVLVNV